MTFLVFPLSLLKEELMAQERFSKSEIRYVDNGIRMKIGTLDKKKHDVIYVNMATYLTPKENKMSYVEDIADIRTSLGKRISDVIKKDGRFRRDFIFNFDISDTRVKYGKPTFLTMMAVMRFRDMDDDKFLNIAPGLKDTVVKDIRNTIDAKITETFEYHDVR